MGLTSLESRPHSIQEPKRELDGNSDRVLGRLNETRDRGLLYGKAHSTVRHRRGYIGDVSYRQLLARASMAIQRSKKQACEIATSLPAEQSFFTASTPHGMF